MKHQTLVLILLAVLILGGEGGLDRAEETLQKRAVNKKGDHLYNNIARAFTKMIQDIFEETQIHRFCRARPGAQFIVEDTTDKNKEVTDQFPLMKKAFDEYRTDQLLTTARDSLSVYGQAHQGADENSRQWSENIEDLRRRVFAFINRFVEIQIQGQPRPKETMALQDSVREKIKEIVDRREYVDQDAKNIFLRENKQKKVQLEKVTQVEERSREVLEELPAEANKWAVEAASFIRKKFKGN